MLFKKYTQGLDKQQTRTQNTVNHLWMDRTGTGVCDGIGHVEMCILSLSFLFIRIALKQKDNTR